MSRPSKPENWCQFVNLMTQDQRTVLLAQVLRTRRRVIPFGFNGVIHYGLRSDVRDYLREKAESVKP